MNTINNSSHIFYIIFIMLCSILIINIVERKFIEDLITKKKNINPIFYEKILQNLKIGKIILYIGLFTIFVILINPIKLLSIMNPNIFSIYGDQYTYIINYLNNTKFCDTPNLKYLKVKPSEIIYLDKSVSEFVLNTSDELILDRILSDFNYDKEKLCNLTKSIELENILKKIDINQFQSTYTSILEKINNEESIRIQQGGAEGEKGDEEINEEGDADVVGEKKKGEENKEILTELEKENEKKLEELEKDLQDMGIIKSCDKDKTELDKIEKELIEKMIVKPNNKFKNEKNEIVLLDDSQYGKFNSFNKIIKNIALSKITEYNFNPKYHIVFVLFFNYSIELFFDIIQVIETRPKNDDIEIIIPNESEPITISTIIYNIVILACILQLLNNKVWLTDSQLINSDSNRFIPLLLFTINTVSKFIFKGSKYVTYDNFLTLKITSLLCNSIMISIIGTSLIKIWEKPDPLHDYPDFITCNHLYKHISKETTISKIFKTFYLYPSLFHIIPLSYIIHSLNDKYYVKKRAANHYINHVDIGLMLFYIMEFIILVLIYPQFSNKVNPTFHKYEWFGSYFTIGEAFRVWVESFANNDNKHIYISSPGTFLNVLWTGFFAYMLFYTLSYIPNNELEDKFWVSIFSIILLFIAGVILPNIEKDGLNIPRQWFFWFCAIFGLAGFLYSSIKGIHNNAFREWKDLIRYTLAGVLLQYACFVIFNENTLMVVGHIAIIIALTALSSHFENKNNQDMKQLTVAGGILLLLIGELFINKYSWSKKKLKTMTANSEEFDWLKERASEGRDIGGWVVEEAKKTLNPNMNEQKGGGSLINSIETADGIRGELINNQENKLSDTIIKVVIIGAMAYIAYRIYKNYTDKKNKKKIKGGNIKKTEDLDNLGVEISPTDVIDKQILQLGIFIIILLILYGNNLLNTDDLKTFIDEGLLNPTNLNVLRLMFFPFIILAIIIVIGGQKFFRSILLRQMEKESIGNLTIKKDIKNKYKDSLKDKDVIDKTGFRVFKYVSFVAIIGWYVWLVYNTRIALSSTLIVNLIIIGVYIFLIQHAIYIFYKIYMNENVNKITDEVEKIMEIKNTVKFKKGKINPKAIEEIIEIDTDKLKIEYEQFINEVYTNIYDMLSINNIFITSAIEFYIKTKLIKHKKLEDEFHLSVTNQENNIKEEEAINKLDINGKWTNEKDDNNILVYVYGSVAIVLYLNKTSYQNMKMPNIVNKGTMYEFIENNELLFTYVNEKIVIDNVNYTKLSNEFSTDNIIKKTLSENDVFKNLNYMISIDKDSKYIGKYNLVEDLTKYNLYKNNGDPLKSKIEEIILNKVLLIKAIRDGKYKEANIYSKKLNVLETKFRKKQRFNRFDTNRDGVIDSNEIENYVNKNHKLSSPGNVKIKSAIFDGTHLIITFDKKITNNDNSFKNVATANADSNFTDINLENIFKLRINDEDKTSFIDNQVNIFNANGEFLIGTNNATASYNFITSNNYPNDDVHYIKIINTGNVKTDTTSPKYTSKGKWAYHDISASSSLSQTNIYQLTAHQNNVNSYTIIEGVAGAAGSPYTFTNTTNAKTIFKNFEGIKFKVVDNYGNDIINNKVNINNPNIEILNKDTLKIKLKEDVIQQLNTSNNIKLYIFTETYINVRPPNTSVTPNITNINRTLKTSSVKIHKTINNFEEFDASIFGT